MEAVADSNLTATVLEEELVFLDRGMTELEVKAKALVALEACCTAAMYTEEEGGHGAQAGLELAASSGATGVPTRLTRDQTAIGRD